MQNAEKTNEQLTNQLVEVCSGVLVVQLCGMWKRLEMNQLVERVRERIMKTNSRVVVVDVTSIPSIDTKMAQYLIDIIREAQLLGAQLVLTGVQTTICQSLAHLGVDLSILITRWSLAAGLWVALDMIELPVVNKTNRKWNDRKRNRGKLPV